MIRFTFLEQAGLALAVMSDKRDGDCGGDTDAQENVETLMARLRPGPSYVLRMRQAHGTRIVTAAAQRWDTPEADGVITCQPSLALGVTVADCVPVILYNPVRKTMAALHAGREGIRHNIPAKGVRMLCAQYGGSPEQLLVLTGPAAGVCCYEVSPEMAQDWRSKGLPAIGRKLDMGGAIRLQLENAGVIRHNIQVVPHCTVCGGGFYSYRADKTSHRNLVIVML